MSHDYWEHGIINQNVHYYSQAFKKLKKFNYDF